MLLLLLRAAAAAAAPALHPGLTLRVLLAADECLPRPSAAVDKLGSAVAPAGVQAVYGAPAVLCHHN